MLSLYAVVIVVLPNFALVSLPLPPTNMDHLTPGGIPIYSLAKPRLQTKGLTREEDPEFQFRAARRTSMLAGAFFRGSVGETVGKELLPFAWYLQGNRIIAGFFGGFLLSTVWSRN